MLIIKVLNITSYKELSNNLLQACYIFFNQGDRVLNTSVGNIVLHLLRFVIFYPTPLYSKQPKTVQNHNFYYNMNNLNYSSNTCNKLKFKTFGSFLWSKKYSCTSFFNVTFFFLVQI